MGAFLTSTPMYGNNFTKITFEFFKSTSTREDSPYLDSFHFKDDYTSNNELN